MNKEAIVIDYTNHRLKNWYATAKADYGVTGEAKAYIKGDLFVIDYTENGVSRRWTAVYYPEYLSNGNDYFFNCWSELASEEDELISPTIKTNTREVKETLQHLEAVKGIVQRGTTLTVSDGKRKANLAFTQGVKEIFIAMIERQENIHLEELEKLNATVPLANHQTDVSVW